MIWKDVVGYCGFYQVSNTGKVRSVDRIITDSLGRTRKMKGKELTPSFDSNGYFMISLSRGCSKSRLVHQLVCESFLGSRPEGKEVLHGPAGCRDNTISNLRYGSKSQNAKDRVRDGTQHLNIRKVIRDDGVIFPSATSAAKDCGATVSNLISVCRKKRRAAGGFSWSYLEETL
jgi:hypothetical protein